LHEAAFEIEKAGEAAGVFVDGEFAAEMAGVAREAEGEGAGTFGGGGAFIGAGGGGEGS
jgi:hypothetical protein